MSIKRAMLTSAAVLALSVFWHTPSAGVFGHPAASGNGATVEADSSFILVRGGRSGGHGGFGGYGSGGGGGTGGHNMASGIRGGHGFATSGPSSFAVTGPRGGRIAGTLANRSFRHGRLVRGHFTDGRFRNRRFVAGTGFVRNGVWWDVPYYDNNFLGGTCFANCIAAGHGPRYCSIYASDFC
jgi:hypothetical protein